MARVTSQTLGRRLVPAALLLVVVVFGAVLYADAAALRAALGGFDLRVLPVALALSSANYAIRFARWQLYLAHLGIAVPRRVSGEVFVSGLSMTITPGKLGELLKCFMLKDRFGIGVATTAPVVVAERYTDIVGIVLLAALGALRFPDAGPLLVAGAAVVVGVLVAALVSDTLTERAGAALARSLFRGRMPDLDWARASAAGFRRLLQGTPLVLGTALATLAWFLECAAFLVVLRGFGETGVGVLGATVTYATATLAGALSMLPGGLGATEAGMAALLGGLGVGRATAASATLVIRACTLWWGVAVGTVALLAQGDRARRALATAGRRTSEPHERA